MKTAMREYIKEQSSRTPSSPRDGGGGSDSGKYRDFFAFVSGASVGGTGHRHAASSGGRVVVAHASSGYGQSLQEVLQNERVMEMIKDTKAAAEVNCLARFEKMIVNDSDRAVYGPGHVRAAAEVGAIDCLLVTDSHIRSANPEERALYAGMIEDVGSSGGDVMIFSSLHVSGQRLQQLSGVGACLRFPVPFDEDDDEEELEG